MESEFTRRLVAENIEGDCMSSLLCFPFDSVNHHHRGLS